MDQENWYLVNTQAGSEKVAAEKLDSLGLEALLPRILERRSNGFGRRYEREMALFRGYLFARCSLDDYARATYGMRKSVLRLVNFGSGPAVVDDLLIERIKSRIGPDGYVMFDDDIPARPRSSCPFKPDQNVRITDGVWAGFTAVFKRETKSAERVVLLMNICGAAREVQFPLQHVEPLTFPEAEYAFV
jgi:transcription antitermination factor NusG